jgi:hypothetical protein
MWQHRAFMVVVILLLSQMAVAHGADRKRSASPPEDFKQLVAEPADNAAPELGQYLRWHLEMRDRGGRYGGNRNDAAVACVVRGVCPPRGTETPTL